MQGRRARHSRACSGGLLVPVIVEQSVLHPNLEGKAPLYIVLDYPRNRAISTYIRKLPNPKMYIRPLLNKVLHNLHLIYRRSRN